MKSPKFSPALSAAVLMLCLSPASAFAVEKTATPTPEKEASCSDLKEACVKAGFKRGAHRENGKGLMADCMAKLVKGEKVDGVLMDPADPAIGSCKEALVQRGGSAQPTSTPPPTAPKGRRGAH
ncbi:MAG: hypothetical protein HC902_12435 [Calothrix sp. SM1_5_4]|nr:hypothetical protein [Calothrix sp. SM1_5_4]